MKNKETLFNYFRENKDKFSLEALRQKAIATGYPVKEVNQVITRIEKEQEIMIPELAEEPTPKGINLEKVKPMFKKLVKMRTKTNEMPILFLRNSGKAEPMKVTPKDGMFLIGGQYYHEKYGSDWEIIEGLSRKKIKIIPEWGLYPLGNSDYLEELKAEHAEVQHDMVRAVQTAETVRWQEERGKGKINPKLAVLVIIGIIVVAYFVLGG